MPEQTKWVARRTYYPASRFAGTDKERNAQFRGPRGGLYDVRFVRVPIKRATK